MKRGTSPRPEEEPGWGCASVTLVIACLTDRRGLRDRIMRCACGQELGEEGLHACPSCGEIVDPAGLAEKAIQVDGRMLPLRAWEGEVLLRGAAWVAGLHAASLVMALTAYALRAQMDAVPSLLLVLFVAGGTAWILRFNESPGCSGLLVTGVGATMIVMSIAARGSDNDILIFVVALLACPVALAVLRRSRVAVVLLAVICLCWLVFLYAEARHTLARPELTVRWLAIAISPLPPLFCLAALLGKPARIALGAEFAGQPVALLGSVRAHSASPLGWASLGFVGLSWLFAALWVALGVTRL